MICLLSKYILYIYYQYPDMLEESVPQQDDTEPRQEAGKIKSLREQPY